MIKYRVNDKFVDKETFFEELRKSYDKQPQHRTFDDFVAHIESDGYVYLVITGKIYIWNMFCAADEEVFEMENIICENEYDALDNDAFAIAYALYKHGYKRQKEDK